MTLIILVSLVFLIGLGIGIFVFWLMFREKERLAAPAPDSAPPPRLAFSWGYVALPLALLAISIVLAAVFYPRLSPEVAYRFNFDGTPKNVASRQTIVLVTLFAQVILALMAYAIVWGAARLSGSSGQADTMRTTRRLVLVMGNMIAIPQVVVGFVMADIFGYNVYSRHMLPLWSFALAVMAIAGIILVVFFVRTIRRSNKRQ